MGQPIHHIGKAVVTVPVRLHNTLPTLQSDAAVIVASKSDLDKPGRGVAFGLPVFVKMPGIERNTREALPDRNLLAHLREGRDSTHVNIAKAKIQLRTLLNVLPVPQVAGMRLNPCLGHSMNRTGISGERIN